MGGGGGGTRPWWLALLACGGAYWPLALEPSAMTSRHPHFCGYLCGGRGVPRVQGLAEPPPPPPRSYGSTLITQPSVALKGWWASQCSGGHRHWVWRSPGGRCCHGCVPDSPSICAHLCSTGAGFGSTPQLAGMQSAPSYSPSVCPAQSRTILSDRSPKLGCFHNIGKL